MKSPLFLAPLALLALSACGEANKPAAQPSDAAAMPDAKPGITVADGMLSLPVVKGRPGAAYFAVTNGSAAAVTLAAVTIDGAAKAEMHETKGGTMAPLGMIELKPGESVRFERGGKHVMVFDLAETVKAGGTAEMTLTFAGGDKVSVPLKVESMSGAMDMEGHGN
ncbi:copper chaperone PCu(A)C [Novosphingobium sp. JCM 18896]|uniref:copper chaperone PCu(A)C n=1 Tax=Novosphingobium sp. JCM 18896 TaxID=2989731 RepID=UPI002223C4DF|nr:copper chaperone PCu(A)C [Novosphingobium sp. JCM 18896]MCW1428440.1 copper chaperone PCu(A)C [Novosphingobium sp. JCM 18896]